MNKISKIFVFFVSLAAVTMVSCENDLTEAGASLPDDNDIKFEKYVFQEIKTSVGYEANVNVRDLPINTLGYYNHNLFGEQTYHLVTQVKMVNENDLSKIGENAVLDSVYVYLPFENIKKNQTSNSTQVYTEGDGTFDLKVYENGYLLSASNPSADDDIQYYYSNDKPLFDAQKGSVLNTSLDNSQNTNFKFNTDDIKVYKYDAEGNVQEDQDGNKLTESIKPGVWLDLDRAYFQTKFFDSKSYQSILNNAMFTDFFRGFYFEVSNTSASSLAQFDLTEAQFVFVYKQDADSESGVEHKILRFKMGKSTDNHSISVNLIDEDTSEEFEQAITNNSDSEVWLKGGNASYCKLNLLLEDELSKFKDKQWLINQAVLTVTVNQDVLGENIDTSPKRLYLYDFKNNKVIADYISDETSQKQFYNGIYNSTEKKYKFSLTDYLKNRIDSDEEQSSELGLVVATDILNTVFNVTQNEGVKIPLTSIAHPFGTVVYGADYSDLNKQMKLEVYYTKVNN